MRDNLEFLHDAIRTFGKQATFRSAVIVFELAKSATPMKHRDLAKAGGMVKGALTRLSVSLARAGLITRRRSGDKRDVFYSLTDKGKAFAAAHMTARRAA